MRIPEKARMLYLADDFEGDSDPEAEVAFIPFPDEHELLTEFWRVVPSFNRIVTFNGRGFDARSFT